MADEQAEQEPQEQQEPPPRPDAPQEECPKCEDCPECVAGAPAWMATFADMATLLMAFFVLILSFAEMNVPKFKQISGSMKNSFGIQRLIPIVEPPKADSLVAREFSPARAEPTPLNQVRQETTDERKENVELRTDVAPPSDQQRADLDKVKKALQDQIAKGEVEAKVENGQVVVQVNEVPDSGAPLRGSDQTSGNQKGGVAQGNQSAGAGATGAQSAGAAAAGQASAGAAAAGQQAAGAADQGAQAAGTSAKGQANAGQAAQGQAQAGEVPQGVIDLYAKVAQVQSEVASKVTVRQSAAAAAGSGNANVAQTDNEFNRIRKELAQEIQAGKAEVERDGARIIIRLAEQGSFQSGSADLQPGFVGMLNKVGASIAQSKGRIFIEGHTDNVPVVYNQRFQSNWDLSGARAGAVADHLIAKAGLADSRVSVSGFADTRPVDSNDNAAGRARNRRIEVIIDGAK